MQKGIAKVESKVNEVFAKTFITQEFVNDTDNPIELKCYLNKNYYRSIFSSFNAQIGESIKVRSKVLKEDKAEEKYTDAISKGSVAIFTTVDPENEDLVIVHIGNIPPKEKMVFISEFIQSIESSEHYYEFALFDSINLPIIKLGDQCLNIGYDLVECEIEIKTQNKIDIIEKKNLSDKLVIKEERFEKEKNLFTLKYEYDYNDFYKNYNIGKIFFKLETNYNIILFSQLSQRNKGEKNFLLNYSMNEINNKEKECIKLKPGLFIILVDQRFYFTNKEIFYLDDALRIFFNSIPAGSYYQLISDYYPYDSTPKEYNQENIEETMEIIKGFIWNTAVTNLNGALNYLCDSKDKYKKFSLPKHIFLFTEGLIFFDSEDPNLIKNLSNDFLIHHFANGSISIHDEDYFKNVDYNSYESFRDLYKIIAVLNKISGYGIEYLDVNSSLDEINLYQLNSKININKKISSISLYYIIQEKIDKNIFDFVFKYRQDNKDYLRHYKLSQIELPPGDELSKLNIYKYIIYNKNILEKEKINLAIKYQLLIEGTSLFVEAELSEKIYAPMIYKSKAESKIENKKRESPILEGNNPLNAQVNPLDNVPLVNSIIHQNNNIDPFGEMIPQIDLINSNRQNNNLFDNSPILDQGYSPEQPNSPFGSQKLTLNPFEQEDGLIELIKELKNDQEKEQLNKYSNMVNPFEPPYKFGSKYKKFDPVSQKEIIYDYPSIKKEKSKEDIEEEFEYESFLDKKDFMKIIFKQNIVEGFWDIKFKKNQLKKNPFEKEFNILKEKNIDDITALTIIITYYIEKDFGEEMVMIINKAKFFIKNKVCDSYENIIRKTGLI